ncbi:MAG: hypothetical protein V3T79_01120, partial [Candidatus Scalindua sediminis]
QQRTSAGKLTRTESQNLHTSFAVTRLFHDWIVNMSISKTNTRDETITSFDIIPRGAAAQLGGLKSRFQAVRSFLPPPEQEP